MNKIVKLVGCILFCELVGVAGGLFTFSSIKSWYFTLQKPFFSPPNWIFGPVWTILYALMGISLFLILEVKPKNKKKITMKREVLMIFSTQLLFNFLWSIIFFGLHLPNFAFYNIGVLWALILLFIVKSYEISKNAAILQIPYLLWVSFASILNLAIILLNK